MLCIQGQGETELDRVGCPGHSARLLRAAVCLPGILGSDSLKMFFLALIIGKQLTLCATSHVYTLCRALHLCEPHIILRSSLGGLPAVPVPGALSLLPIDLLAATGIYPKAEMQACLVLHSWQQGHEGTEPPFLWFVHHTRLVLYFDQDLSHFV